MIPWSRLERSSLLKYVPVVSPEKGSGLTTFQILRRFALFYTAELLHSRKSTHSCAQEPFASKLGAPVRVSGRSPSTCGIGAGDLSPTKSPRFSCRVRYFCTGNHTATSQSYPKQPVLEAQVALFDYLHCTRGLDFSDAEYVSKNSPIFLGKILKKVGTEGCVGNLVTRFLRYHPINEFEPFFESLGLKPAQFNRFLPKDLTFLSDADLMMMNFHVLCNYGVAWANIGKIYCEAAQIFRYEYGVLASKLRAYEEIGLSKVGVINLVSSSPPLLIGSVNQDLIKVAEQLEDLGINREWIAKNVVVNKSYHWGQMIMLMHFLSELGLDKLVKVKLITREPNCLLDGSGRMVFGITVLLTKLGATRVDVETLFSQFPAIHAGTFLRNLQKGLKFLIDIDMDSKHIGTVMLFRPQLLGCSSLFKACSALRHLAIGKNRLCEIIAGDPYQFLSYTKGSKLEPLLNSQETHLELLKKKKFLSILGFVDNTKEMEKALRIFRAKAEELQNGYNYLITKGLDSKDITKMLTVAPLILCQKPNELKSKVEFLTDGMGYPVESLVRYPNCLLFSLERLKLRFSMYSWLRGEGTVKPELSWATILKRTDKSFIKTYVNHHPQGPEVWDKFRRAIYTC